jgi:predicted NUDIX family NTP pyrophosphohydrolase
LRSRGALESGSFELEWPPRSGKLRTCAEADRTAWWFTTAAARKNILPGLVVFIDRLEALSV